MQNTDIATAGGLDVDACPAGSGPRQGSSGAVTTDTEGHGNPLESRYIGFLENRAGALP
jgi:hypothetical protein